jgi:CubicO group peptidase (beta-lactamase class C family)
MSRAIERATAFLSTWLPYQVEQTDITGLQVAIQHKGRLVFSSAYGWADKTRSEPLGTQNIFNIGSLAKMMTATAVMQLAEEGKLQLSDLVVAYIPWLANHPNPLMKTITIGQLLEHRANLARDGLQADFWQLERPFPDHRQLERLVSAAELTAGNGKFKYSNLGYALLGEVIEQAGGKPYATYATERIIEPLKLEHTFPDYTPSIEARIATGYTRRIAERRRALPRAVPTFSFAPVAGWYANAEDVCKFLTAHCSHQTALLPLGAKKKMYAKQPAPGSINYGKGFMTYNLDGHTLIGHGGGFIGHTSLAFYSPERELSIAVLSNAKDAPTFAAVRGILNSWDYFLQYITGPVPSAYDKASGRFMNLWTTMDMVALTDHLAAVRLGDWIPFLQAEQLKYVKPRTFKITKASEVSAAGETVVFTAKKQSRYINYAGQKLFPEAVYIKWLTDNLSAI